MKDTGGPAFPTTEKNGCNNGWPGLDLRDYFAAKAMQGFAADPNVSGTIKQIAASAYLWADAMLEARK